MRAAPLLFLLIPLACSDPPPEPKAKPTTQPDAAPTPPNPTPAKPIANSPPAAEFHLDPDPEPSRASPTARTTNKRPIELVLRSTPPGATASVDGQAVGKTPSYWQGTADGRPRDVTFALPGYAVARYRFVAIHSGVVHGSLRKLTKAEPRARK